MSKGLYRRLAAKNIKSNKNIYLPFFICAVAMVALFYMMSAMCYGVANSSFYGQASVKLVLDFGEKICGGFGFFVILYTNSYLVKCRSRELGLYSILGMEKKHINRVLFWELFQIGALSLVAGLGLGISFSKLMTLLMENIIKIKGCIPFGIWLRPIAVTVILFAVVFAISIVGNCIRVGRLKPMDLMRSGKTGEKEPKANWVLAILGVVCLGAGYYIAITTESPLKALELFAAAVVLVIVGTYFVFVSGMVALLKLLKKNPSYYYKKNHFITVSGLIYRMKHNAVGLANICILSTAVLVLMFSTIALYVGSEDSIESKYPNDVRLVGYKYASETEVDYDRFDHELSEQIIHERAEEYNVEVLDEAYGFHAVLICEFDGEEYKETGDIMNGFVTVNVLTLDEYNRMTGEAKELAPNEVFYCSNVDDDMMGHDFSINGCSYKVAGILKEQVNGDLNVSDGVATVVVRDTSEMEKFVTTFLVYEYSFDTKGSTEDVSAMCRAIDQDFAGDKVFPHYSFMESKADMRTEIYTLFGSLFFIGTFIGLMFITTTAMIIYYKQVSEGNEDREKFQIMRKVGMSDEEIKDTIRSQVLTIFLLPIVFAVIHIICAFSAIRKIMVLFAINNVGLLVGCLVATVLVYLIIYVAIYKLTARSYYKCLML